MLTYYARDDARRHLNSPKLSDRLAQLFSADPAHTANYRKSESTKEKKLCNTPRNMIITRRIHTSRTRSSEEEHTPSRSLSQTTGTAPPKRKSDDEPNNLRARRAPEYPLPRGALYPHGDGQSHPRCENNGGGGHPV